ncbi:hypothetical protein KSD_04770 [Ktedonobacter sp. SOSP1-85]|uniref:hypothetical protein n=1 Tax=Ktedonobacter sp. SOSP1-85 TaxID=2778367 RepID=UPI0019151C6C|nr:hypothetical protein [Ktedonobacter sp. SOSP1-85]GHO72706.1 hypothetical protein KSD_04770 [Ktedonobacter sp. SOSP1-85]
MSSHENAFNYRPSLLEGVSYIHIQRHIPGYVPGRAVSTHNEQTTGESARLSGPETPLPAALSSSQGKSFSSSPGNRPPQAPRGTLRRVGKRKYLLPLFLLVVLILGLVQVASAMTRANMHLLVRIGDVQESDLDLNQSLPISPYLFGSNVFPKAGSDSQDQQGSGFMRYDAGIVAGLRSARIRLLRFPGGEWGEEHTLSSSQLDDFSQLLQVTGADGLMQSQLSNPSQQDTLATRASRAGLLVDYMNNPKSIQRASATTPYHPVKYWTVGNEPDRLKNPDTGATFTAIEYAQAFIQYSIAMHQNDPTIKVFGPEISQFYGAGLGPYDSAHNLWMETFLQIVSRYEQSHPNTKYHLLDGVSFHRYPLDNASQATNLLLNSTGEWNDLISSLRQSIRQDFGRDLPVAVTEVNTNPKGDVPPPDYAALWWADTLGKLMNQQVEYAAFFSTQGVDAPYPLFTARDGQQTVMLRIMQLFAHLQADDIATSSENDSVSLYATQDDAHNTVSMLLINKEMNTEIVHVRPNSGLLPLSAWHAQDVTLKGHSLVLLTLHRNGTNEAYTFSPAQATFSDPTPGIRHTICGQQSEALTITC